MRRVICVVCLLVSAATTHAGDFAYLTLAEWRGFSPEMRMGYVAGYAEAFEMLGLACPVAITRGEVHDYVMANVKGDYFVSAGVGAYLVMRGCRLLSDESSVKIRNMFRDPPQHFPLEYR